MADIFLSYAAEDRSRAKVLAEALELRGWSVWWDRSIPLGQSFDNVIEDAIGASRCVIVLWSGAAVASEWVRSEASEGKRRGILVPALLEAVDPPLAFRLLNAADLTDWQPGTLHTEYDRLVGRIAELLGRPGLPQQKYVSSLEGGHSPIPKERRRHRLAWIAGGLSILLIAVVVYAGYRLQSYVQQFVSTGALPMAGGAATPPGAFDPLEFGGLGLRVFEVQDLGLHIAFIPPEQAMTLGSSGPSSGAVVWRIESGTAQAAGIHTGDGILAIAGRQITTEDDLRRAILDLAPGKSQYRIRRGTQTMTIEIDCPTCK